MSEFTAKKLKEARMRAGLSQDESANLMKLNKRAISQIEAAQRNISADELAQFSRIYEVDVRELLFVDFTEAGEEKRLAAKYSVVNGRFCPQSVRSFCPIVAGFNAGTYKVPACVL